MGDLKISERTAASALTGAEIIGAIQSGADRRTTSQDIADLAANGVKKYKFTIAQKQGNDPTVIDYINELSGTPVWVKSIDGVYNGTLVGAFPANKTFINPKVTTGLYISAGGPVYSLITYRIDRISDDVIQYTQSDVNGNLIDHGYYEDNISFEINILP